MVALLLDHVYTYVRFALFCSLIGANSGHTMGSFEGEFSVLCTSEPRYGMQASGQYCTVSVKGTNLGKSKKLVVVVALTDRYCRLVNQKQ